MSKSTAGKHKAKNKTKKQFVDSTKESSVKGSSVDKKDEKEEDEYGAQCNKICLNFSREVTHPEKDRFNLVKVKELFKCLSTRQDLQEMKVSGWFDDGKEEQEEEEEEEVEGILKEDSRSYIDTEDRTPRDGGQRFAMSRDFWYRKLNILKARKLDEAALEAKDISPGTKKTAVNCMKLINNQKIYSDEVPEKKEEILQEINRFEISVAKPAEAQFKNKFVNVYNNKNYFHQHDCE